MLSASRAVGIHLICSLLADLNALLLINQKLIKRHSWSSLSFVDVQGLRSVQPRIEAWLGLSADASDALAVSQQAASGVGGVARWHPDSKLGLTVPFPEDQSLVVWLDKTLPQVIWNDDFVV